MRRLSIGVEGQGGLDSDALVEEAKVADDGRVVAEAGRGPASRRLVG